MHSKIKLLSYSSLLKLHSCPREFELYRLNSVVNDTEDIAAKQIQNATFAFGHVVGAAVTDILQHKTENEILFNIFTGWYADYDFVDKKRHKSIHHAMLAAQKLHHLFNNEEILEGYELLYYKGKPTAELGFTIKLPNDFILRGSMDAVLQHKLTKKVIVLECKTSSSYALDEASYGNSAQAASYSVVLDTIVPELASYTVMYLVYTTPNKEWNVLQFNKTKMHKALYLNELKLDTDIISLYEEAGVFPMRGESCVKYNRQCKYYGVCTLSNDNLVPAAIITDTKLAESAAQRELLIANDIELNFSDLIAAQLLS